MTGVTQCIWRLRVDCACSTPSGADAGDAPHIRRDRFFRQRLLTGVGSGAPRVSTVCFTSHAVVASVGFRARGSQVVADRRPSSQNASGLIFDSRSTTRCRPSILPKADMRRRGSGRSTPRFVGARIGILAPVGNPDRSPPSERGAGTLTLAGHPRRGEPRSRGDAWPPRRCVGFLASSPAALLPAARRGLNLHPSARGATPASSSRPHRPLGPRPGVPRGRAAGAHRGRD